MRILPMVAGVFAEQAEKGTREVPIEGMVRPGVVATPQTKVAASMANVPRRAWRSRLRKRRHG
jgi:hypothetical protein